MNVRSPAAVVAALAAMACASSAWAYVEVPYTLGKTVEESTSVVLLEVKKADQERKYILFKKVADLKGKYEGEEVKHNIGERGFHEREWKNIMAWAQPGAQAVMFSNADASETCIGTYWYQCYKEGEWWGLTHAEPYMLRTFYGESKILAEAVAKVVSNQEAIIPCLVDANRNQLHLRKGKVQLLRASLKRHEYNAKRDFVSFSGEDAVELKTDVLVAQSSGDWKFLPAPSPEKMGTRWRATDFDESSWRTGKTPIGYGEDELANRQGTTVAEQGKAFLFRRTFDVPEALLATKGVALRLCVASDNKATVFLNGKQIDDDPEADHEFSYWNREIELTPKQFVAGRNVLAFLVTNAAGSSDLFLDAELVAETPLPGKEAAKKK